MSYKNRKYFVALILALLQYLSISYKYKTCVGADGSATTCDAEGGEKCKNRVGIDMAGWNSLRKSRCNSSRLANLPLLFPIATESLVLSPVFATMLAVHLETALSVRTGMLSVRGIAGSFIA
jgi:hypothetical protein